MISSLKANLLAFETTPWSEATEYPVFIYEIFALVKDLMKQEKVISKQKKPPATK